MDHSNQSDVAHEIVSVDERVDFPTIWLSQLVNAAGGCFDMGLE